MVDWDDAEQPKIDAEQIAFERAAIEAAHGYLRTLDELHEALLREEKLKRQLAALVGLK